MAQALLGGPWGGASSPPTEKFSSTQQEQGDHARAQDEEPPRCRQPLRRDQERQAAARPRQAEPPALQEVLPPEAAARPHQHRGRGRPALGAPPARSLGAGTQKESTTTTNATS